ncbi:MAG: 30S ribosomal protein S11 [Lentisphaerae bacterium]|jgi:small subunit ribosomal protein S11|nr:30S ribosomal protein S11 [Lentisphaerota bacterium]MBT5608271.1 30S ribosomal protein S11 [Lentisphaerota bacterium]MBT7061829.1 30S ribosomal protein S11 [Lentisphaerota bacterium]MBT7846138.1 30S ribosomal protein S11 [Lentisphaerota bacterium]
MADDNPEAETQKEVLAAPVAEEAVVAPEGAEAPVASDEEADAAARPVARARSQRHIPSGVASINATFNNTRVCIADQHGNVVAWGSGGRAGFKGSRKSTSYVAQQIGMDVAKRAMSFGMREVEVRMKGPGAGRESAVRGIAAAGLNISVLRDVTPIPHNGCRPPKRRRV